MIFLLLEELILDFVVVSKENHFSIDEGLECVSFEAHIDEEDYIVQHLWIGLRQWESTNSQIFLNNILEVSYFRGYSRVRIVRLCEFDVEK